MHNDFVGCNLSFSFLADGYSYLTLFKASYNPLIVSYFYIPLGFSLKFSLPASLPCFHHKVIINISAFIDEK